MLRGIVVLDTNAIKALERDETFRRVASSLRAAGLAFAPTGLNVIEIVKSENPHVRSRLLSTLAMVAGGAELIPPVLEYLALIGDAIVSGHTYVDIPPSELEWMIYEPERITDDHVRLAQDWSRKLQEPWDRAHTRARRDVKALPKRAGTTDPWGSIPRFLDEQWTRVGQLDSFFEQYWRRMELPGSPPNEELIADEAWRLYFEGMGATIYEQAVQHEMGSKVHVPDVMLLTYLGGATARILVTEDRGLHRIASRVLVRRYSGSRVLKPSELLDLAA